MRQLFERIHGEGKPVVLATSGKTFETSHHVKLLEIGDLITGQMTADDADESKPAPDIFEAALRQLTGIAPNESVVVGDTRFDIEAARRAGSPSIALLCGGKTEAELR